MLEVVRPLRAYKHFGSEMGRVNGLPLRENSGPVVALHSGLQSYVQNLFSLDSNHMAFLISLSPIGMKNSGGHWGSVQAVERGKT